MRGEDLAFEEKKPTQRVGHRESILVGQVPLRNLPFFQAGEEKRPVRKPDRPYKIRADLVTLSLSKGDFFASHSLWKSCFDRLSMTRRFPPRRLQMPVGNSLTPWWFLRLGRFEIQISIKQFHKFRPATIRRTLSQTINRAKFCIQFITVVQHECLRHLRHHW